jgi:hypothetical protein
MDKKIKIFGVAILMAAIVYTIFAVNYVFGAPPKVADHPTKSGLWIRAELEQNPTKYAEVQLDDYMELAIENLGKWVSVPSGNSTRAQDKVVYKVDEKYYKFRAFWVDMWESSESKGYIYSGVSIYAIGATTAVVIVKKRREERVQKT